MPKNIAIALNWYDSVDAFSSEFTEAVHAVIVRSDADDEIHIFTDIDEAIAVGHDLPDPRFAIVALTD